MRTFVAVEIDDKDVQDSISKLQSELGLKAKPIPKESMHITLVFLGEISQNDAESVKEALDSVSFSQIELNFTQLGAFPNARAPRVVWLGPEQDSEAAVKLSDLAKQVQSKIDSLGVVSQNNSNRKAFKPHLTIFRIKGRPQNLSETIQSHQDISIGPQVISELKFKKSELYPDGPVYSDLHVVRAS